MSGTAYHATIGGCALIVSAALRTGIGVCDDGKSQKKQCRGRDCPDGLCH